MVCWGGSNLGLFYGNFCVKYGVSLNKMLMVVLVARIQLRGGGGLLRGSRLINQSFAITNSLVKSFADHEIKLKRNNY